MLFKITRDSGIPLMGCIAFGIIDRGTNVLEVRVTGSCNISCTFCSVDAGPLSKTRKTVYEVELDYLLDWVKDIVKLKDREDIEIHLDSTGEPMMYPKFMELVKEIRKIPEVRCISMQSNGTLLSKEKIKQLEEAGVDRINLSIMTLDPELAKKLAGSKFYDIEKIKQAAKYVVSSKMDLMLTPVFMHGLNDEDIPKLIEFAKEIGAGKKGPAIGIQNYMKYKFGRKPKEIKTQNWWGFYNKFVKKWEKEHDVRLIFNAEKDFGIVKCKSVPIVMDVDEKVNIEIKGPGWLKNEKLGVAKGRAISVINCTKESGMVRAKIVSNKHNIYVAKLI